MWLLRDLVDRYADLYRLFERNQNPFVNGKVVNWLWRLASCQHHNISPALEAVSSPYLRPSLFVCLFFLSTPLARWHLVSRWNVTTAVQGLKTGLSLLQRGHRSDLYSGHCVTYVRRGFSSDLPFSTVVHHPSPTSVWSPSTDQLIFDCSWTSLRCNWFM